MNIRRGVPDDAAILAELGERTFRDAFGADNTVEDMTSFIARSYGITQQRRELEDAEIVTLLAEQDRNVIGFAQLRLSDPPELARLYVDRAHHGRGIAQELMSAIMLAAREHGARSLWLGVWERNPRAIAFYEKFGFQITGKQPFLLGSDLQTDYVMTVQLDVEMSRSVQRFDSNQ